MKTLVSSALVVVLAVAIFAAGVQLGFSVGYYWLRNQGNWNCTPVRWVYLEEQSARVVELQCVPDR